MFETPDSRYTGWCSVALALCQPISVWKSGKERAGILHSSHVHLAATTTFYGDIWSPCSKFPIPLSLSTSHSLAEKLSLGTQCGNTVACLCSASKGLSYFVHTMCWRSVPRLPLWPAARASKPLSPRSLVPARHARSL